jgi:hypothetical protein
VLSKVPTIAKALTAGVTAFGSAFTLALPNGITAGEWVSIAVATAIATAAVWAIPNKPEAEVITQTP